MAKKDMKRYFPKTDKNDVKPVPQMSGKVKSGKAKAKPIKSAEGATHNNSYNALNLDNSSKIPSIFGFSDNDLSAENLANDFDMTAADLQDFGKNR